LRISFTEKTASHIRKLQEELEAAAVSGDPMCSASSASRRREVLPFCVQWPTAASSQRRQAAAKENTGSCCRTVKSGISGFLPHTAPASDLSRLPEQVMQAYHSDSHRRQRRTAQVSARAATQRIPQGKTKSAGGTNGRAAGVLAISQQPLLTFQVILPLNGQYHLNHIPAQVSILVTSCGNIH